MLYFNLVFQRAGEGAEERGHKSVKLSTFCSASGAKDIAKIFNARVAPCSARANCVDICQTAARLKSVFL